MRTYNKYTKQYVTGWRAWRHELSLVVGGLVAVGAVFVIACVSTALGGGSWQ